jgi:hypothetical protein
MMRQTQPACQLEFSFYLDSLGYDHEPEIPPRTL